MAIEYVGRVGMALGARHRRFTGPVEGAARALGQGVGIALQDHRAACPACYPASYSRNHATHKAVPA